MRRLLPLLFLLSPPLIAAELWPSLSTPPAANNIGSRDAALVIGIEKYAALPAIPGADQNAKDWYVYLTRTLGIPAQRAKLMLDGDATKDELLGVDGHPGALQTMARQVQAGGRLWVVFIGHGAPAPDGKDGLLVGWDAQQTAMSIIGRGIPQKTVMEVLGDTPAVLVLDACFSGKGSDGGALASGLQPAVPLYALTSAATILTAAKGDEFAGPLPGGNRPAYSYLLLGALRGWGDWDGDGRVTLGEAHRYAAGALMATLHGRRQDPEAHGDAAHLVVGAGHERGPDLSEIAVAVAGGTYGPAEVITATPSTTTWTAEDDAVLAAQEKKVRRTARESAEAEQAEELRRLSSARQAAVATEWQKLLAAMGPPEEAGVEERAAVAAKVAAWKGDKVTANGRRVPLSGTVSWNGRSKSLEGAYEEVSAKTVSVDEQVTIAAAERWLQRVPVQASTANVATVGSGQSWTSPTLGEMKWIPPGRFTMGSPSSESDHQDDETQHSVTLTHGYWLMEHEVTQGEWQGVMGNNPAATGQAYWSGKAQGACSWFGNVSLVGENLPVMCVSWGDVQAFIQQVSERDGVKYRLPTEAEWEYAARGGQAQVYAGTGDEDSLCQYANIADARAKFQWSDWKTVSCNDGVAGLAPVKQYRANGYGLYDMTGNVWEWVADWYGAYPGNVTDPTGAPSGDRRGLRGGSWRNGAADARVAFRLNGSPGGRNAYVGFRLLRSSP